MKIKTILAVTAAFLISCTAIINPNEAYTEKASATSLDGQISEYQQKLEALEREEQELQAQMNSTENSIQNEIERQAILDNQIKNTFDTITTMESYISNLEDEIAQLDDQIRKAEEAIALREAEINSGIDDFGLRLRAMYISGDATYANIILSGGDFYDTLMRVELVKRVADYESRIIDELIDLKKRQEAEVEALEIKRKEISQKMQEYATEITNLTNEQLELERLYEESTKSVEELKKWQEEYFLQQAQLNSDKESVEDTLSDLEKQKLEEERRREFERQQQLLLEEQKRKEEQERLEAEQNGGSSGGYDDSDSDNDDTGNDYSGETYSGDLSPVINMAKSMVGGRYSLGSASPTVSDCSGLTLQCYAKIGINLPHKASQQANYGRAVSYNEMKPGDLIFYGSSSYSSIYHVALYIGDGKIIHAESYNTGIVVSNSDSVARYNHITVIKRLVE